MGDEKKHTILVVDDEIINIEIITEILKSEYRIAWSNDGTKALNMANSGTPPDMILLDIMMSGIDGYEVCKILKSGPKTREIPVIFVTSMGDFEDEARGLELGAIDYITKPISPALLKARVRNHLELKRHRDNLSELVMERTRELDLTQEATIQSMTSLTETRDPATGGHIERTRNYVRALACQLKLHPKFSAILDDETIELLYKSAPLHDIGKVGIRDKILLKPGELTRKEFEEMKKHTILGWKALLAAEKKLGSNSFLRLAREMCYTHHERWNGSGYPQGLRGEDIPVSGRLMAVADAYDALISERGYKPSYSHSWAVKLISEGRGRHFDPDMVDAFMAVEKEFGKIAEEFRWLDHENANMPGRPPF